MVELKPTEPHKDLLIQPNDEQLLYKIMSMENLIDSISKLYLHFNRVDSYSDFPNADKYDGEQLPKDRPGNTASKFMKAPDSSAADSYDLSRKRTYACCLSLGNSDYIWNEYGNSGAKGKVCLVFNFDKLRNMLNETFQNSVIQHKQTQYSQIFFINYGLIKYVDWNEYQRNQTALLNPIEYSYIKDNKYNEEKELKITISTLGVGKFAIPFPESLQCGFDFRAAIANGAIQQILHGPDCDLSFFISELKKLGIYKYEG